MQLPTIPAHSAFDIQHLQPNINSMRRPAILLIDDNQDTLQVLSLALASEFNCTGVASRDEALGLLSGGYSPACVVSDYSMPGMTMDEFMQKLANPKFRLVLLSAHALASDVAQKFGIKRTLKKPIDPQDLIIEIKQAIQSGEHPAV